MKKHIYVIFFILFLLGTTQQSFAQIPNASFEDWTNGNPDGWATTNETANGDIAGSIIESNSSHAGSHSVQFAIISFGLGNSHSGIYTGDTSGHGIGFNVSSAPDALHGWYKGTLDSGDEVEVSSGAFERNNSTAGGIITGAFINTNSSVFKEFVFDYSYPLSKEADSVVIGFELLNPSASPHVTSTFTLDDLSFGAATGIKDIQGNNGISLQQNVPNPAIDNACVIYSLQLPTQVTLTITDILGRNVKTVLLNEKQTPGRYKVIVDVNDLANGNYFYRLSAGGNVVSKMMVVAK